MTEDRSQKTEHGIRRTVYSDSCLASVAGWMASPRIWLLNMGQG